MDASLSVSEISDADTSGVLSDDSLKGSGLNVVRVFPSFSLTMLLLFLLLVLLLERALSSFPALMGCSASSSFENVEDEATGISGGLVPAVWSSPGHEEYSMALEPGPILETILPMVADLVVVCPTCLVSSSVGSSDILVDTAPSPTSPSSSASATAAAWVLGASNSSLVVVFSVADDGDVVTANAIVAAAAATAVVCFVSDVGGIMEAWSGDCWLTSLDFKFWDDADFFGDLGESVKNDIEDRREK